MNKLHKLGIAVAAALVTQAAVAADVKVEWKNVDDYRDIEAVSDIQERFQNRVMENLTKHWQELGQKLPADHQLAITMTDLDLTGRIEPTYGVGGSSYIRVLDSLSYPTMTFAFTYTDGTGKVLAESEEVKLKDLADGTSTLRNIHGTSGDNLYREKRLMSEWVREQFNTD